jgi:nitrogen fixation protein FixH
MHVKPSILWPAIIAGALGLHVLVMLAMVSIATSGDSYAVEPDYYRKALEWDNKRAQDRRNIELGWTLEFTVEPAAAGQDPMLRIELTSAEGEPVTGATVAVEAFANAGRDDILKATVNAAASGYETTLPMRRDGLWEFRFTVTRGDEVLTYAETRHIWTQIPD